MSPLAEKGQRRRRDDADSQNFDAYKERESRCSPESVVTPEGTLLDYTDLELRRNPPNVVVDNKTHPTETIITIDSANRPGTLVEVVQCLTELNLMVRGAQISSDGGWFVDSNEISLRLFERCNGMLVLVFYLEESMGGKVIDHKKLETIRQVLKIEYESERHLSHYRPNDERMCEHTVIEMADKDRVGLLYDTTRVIDHAGLDIKSLAAWTQYDRGAIVIGAVTEHGPLQSKEHMALLQSDLLRLLGSNGNVTVKKVKGYIHHERRLHRLLLQEVASQRDQHVSLRTPFDMASSSGLEGAPEVSIVEWPRLKYWRVTISCKDRTKLLFDTLCTLADLDYEVYHASVVSQYKKHTAFQDFYVRPRFGENRFDEEKAAKLKDLLISSILRRAPHGLQVHVLTMDQRGLLCRIADLFKTKKLRVTRAKVKCLTDDMGLPIRHAVHTFFLEGQDGSDACPHEVVELLSAHGGLLAKHMTEDRVPARMDALRDGFAFNVAEWPPKSGLHESLSQEDVPEPHGHTFASHHDAFAVSTSS